jgi:hypothetical protein
VGRGKVGREEGRGGREGRSEDGERNEGGGFDISFLRPQFFSKPLLFTFLKP